MSASDVSPLGVLEEQILVAVLRTSDEAFGMEIRREIERVTGRDITIGAVYATLDRLEEKKLLRSSRVIVEGPSRRVFALTREGARQLAETHALRQQLWAGVDLRKLRLLSTA
jgi:PadR family transcriptional regulator, regulatory protein PadR